MPHPTHTETKTITANGTTDLGTTNNVRYITTNINTSKTISVSIGMSNPNYSDKTAQLVIYVNGKAVAYGSHGCTCINHIKDRLTSATVTI